MVSKINKLIDILISKKYLLEFDRDYYTNIVLGKLQLEKNTNDLSEINDIALLFNDIGNYAKQELKYNKDQFINEIADSLLIKPSEVQANFEYLEKQDPGKAFKYFLNISQDFYYIKYDRLQKNQEWETETEFGKIQITINNAKPEKSQEDILKARLVPGNQYPKCILCIENMGFLGNAKFPSKQNLRIIKKTILDKEFFFQYSPYGYYKEHLIINSVKHEPMYIDSKTINYLLEFVRQYPFYSIGSNADLPIVGGSILSHSHFQGGAGNFPIFKTKTIINEQKGDVSFELLNWPIATIKVSSVNITHLSDEVIRIMNKWYKYKNPKIGIVNDNHNNRNNAITPFARFHKNKYEVYILLRNNNTTKEFPNGYFHVSSDVWNIKKENIGIIEALGKAILPGRLERELDLLALFLYKNKKSFPKELKHHQQWINKINLKKNLSLDEYKLLLRTEVSHLFVKGLKDCNVFKHDENAFKEFFYSIINK